MQEIVVTAIASVCTLIGVIITAIVNLKSNKETKQKVLESSDLTLYRIAQLEHKQDIHNTLIERMYCVEDRLNVVDEKIKVVNNRVKDLEQQNNKQ